MQNSIESSVNNKLENIERKALGAYHKMGSFYNVNNQKFFNFSIIDNKYASENSFFIEVCKSNIIEIDRKGSFKEKLMSLKIPCTQSMKIIKDYEYGYNNNYYYDYLMNTDNVFTDYLELHFSFIFSTELKKEIMDYHKILLNENTSININSNVTHFITEITYGLIFAVKFYIEESFFNNCYSLFIKQEKIESFLKEFIRNINFNISSKTDDKNERDNYNDESDFHKNEKINEFLKCKKYIKAKIIGDFIPVDYCNFISLGKLEHFLKTEIKSYIQNINQENCKPINYSLLNLDYLDRLQKNSLNESYKLGKYFNGINNDQELIDNLANIRKAINIISNLIDLEISTKELLAFYSKVLGKTIFRKEFKELNSNILDIGKLKDKFKGFVIVNFEILSNENISLSSRNSNRFNNFEEELSKFENELIILKDKTITYLNDSSHIKNLFKLFDDIDYLLIDKEFNHDEIRIKTGDYISKISIILNIPRSIIKEINETFLIDKNYSVFIDLFRKFSEMLSPEKEIYNENNIFIRNNLWEFLYISIINYQTNYSESEEKYKKDNKGVKFFIRLIDFKENKEECIKDQKTTISFYYKNQLIYSDIEEEYNFLTKINFKLNFLYNFDDNQRKFSFLNSYDQLKKYLSKIHESPNKHINNLHGCLVISKNFYKENENLSNYEIDAFRNLNNDLDFFKSKNLAVVEYEKLLADEEIIRDTETFFYSNILNINKFTILIYLNQSLITVDYNKEKLMIKEILKIIAENPNTFISNLNIYDYYKQFGNSIYIFLYSNSLFLKNQKAFYENFRLFNKLIKELSVNSKSLAEKEKPIFNCQIKNTEQKNHNSEKISYEIRQETKSKSIKSKKSPLYLNNYSTCHLDHNSEHNFNNCQIKDDFIKSENFYYMESDETFNTQEIKCFNKQKREKLEAKQLIDKKDKIIFTLLNYDEFPYQEHEYFYNQFIGENKNNFDKIKNLRIENISNKHLETIKDSQENQTETLNDYFSNNSDASMRSGINNEYDQQDKDKEIIDKTTIFYIYPDGKKCSDYLNLYYKEKLFMDEKNKVAYKLSENEKNALNTKSKMNSVKTNDDTINTILDNNKNKNIYIYSNKALKHSNSNNQERKNSIDVKYYSQNTEANKKDNELKFGTSNHKKKDSLNFLKQSNKNFHDLSNISKNKKENNHSVEKLMIEDERKNSLYENLDFDFSYFKKNININKRDNTIKNSTAKSLKTINFRQDISKKEYLEDQRLGRKRSSSFCNMLSQSPLRTFTNNKLNYYKVKNEGFSEVQKNSKDKKENYRSEDIFKEKVINDFNIHIIKNLKEQVEDEFFLTSCPEEFKNTNQNNLIEDPKNLIEFIKKTNQFSEEYDSLGEISKSSKKILKKIFKKEEVEYNIAPYNINVKNINNFINKKDIKSIAENFSKHLNQNFYNSINNNMNTPSPYCLKNKNPNETNFINETILNNLINETGTVSILNPSILIRLNLQDLFKLDFIKQNKVLKNDNPLGCVKIINEKFIATGDSRNLKLWNIDDNEIVYVFHGHTDFIYHIEVLKNEPDEVILASASSDGLIKIWDFIGFINILTISPNIGYISCIVLSGANGGSHIICGGDSKIKIYDYKTGIEKKQIISKSKMPYIGNIVINKDFEKELFIASKFGNSNKIEKIDLNNEISEIFYENNSNIASLADIVDNINEKSKNYKKMMLIFGDKNGKIKLLCKETKNILRIYYGHLNRIDYIKQIHLKNSKETMFVSCCYDNSVKIWSLEQPNFIKSLDGHNYAVWMCDELEYDDNFMIVTVSSDKKIIKWSCDL